MTSRRPDAAARPLDHVVLPVPDLATARARLTALGFTVAPDGVHPFGTTNCCVYLADGTFLEPLAVADPEQASTSAKAGNVFTQRDAAYRRDVGENGFSAIVTGSGDADADHAGFTAAGVSAGPMLEFSRPFIDAAGRQDKASFRLAFAADRDAPNVFFFTCQRLHAPKVDRSALQSHANGVTCIRSVLLSAVLPEDYAGIFAHVAGGPPPTAADGGIAAVTGNATLLVLSPSALDSEFAIAAPEGPLRAVGLVFGVADLARAEASLRVSGIWFDHRDTRLVVPPAPGQGATFIFEETA